MDPVFHCFLGVLFLLIVQNMLVSTEVEITLCIC